MGVGQTGRSNDVLGPFLVTEPPRPEAVETEGPAIRETREGSLCKLIS